MDESTIPRQPEPVMRPELVMLIGLQGAGKTTFAGQRFGDTHVLISKDRFRNNRRPERRQQRLIAEALAARRSVVVDNTNPSVVERAALIACARSAGARVIGYVFTSPLPVCRARNANRPPEAQVPDVGLFATVKRFEPPTVGEGFDELWSVDTLSDLRFEVGP
jgi:predicted kinase